MTAPFSVSIVAHLFDVRNVFLRFFAKNFFVGLNYIASEDFCQKAEILTVLCAIRKTNKYEREELNMSSLEQRGFGDEVPTIVNANEPHMALVFVLDTSYSMDGDPIDQLNASLNRFKQEVCKDTQTKSILDVAIIEFNSTHRVVQDFVPIEYMDNVNLQVAGSTNMVPAIREALKMVDDRSRFYRRSGTEPYKPWIFVVTDGVPDSGNDIAGVASEIKTMEQAGRVSFRSLAVQGADLKVLHQLCGEKVLRLDGLDFNAFFDWVNKSMRAVSQSSPGEKPQTVLLQGNVTVNNNPDWD